MWLSHSFLPERPSGHGDGRDQSSGSRLFYTTSTKTQEAVARAEDHQRYFMLPDFVNKGIE